MISLALPSAAAIGRANLRQLGAWAKKLGVANWQSMSKAELIKQVQKAAKSLPNSQAGGRRTAKAQTASHRSNGASARKSGATAKRTPSAKRGGRAAVTKRTPSHRTATRAGGKARSGQSMAPDKTRAAPRPASLAASRATRTQRQTPDTSSAVHSAEAAQKLQELLAMRERQKDLSSAAGPENASPGEPVVRDRLALLVRDAYWLQASWDITRGSVERARAAMAEDWHTAKPILRVYQIESGVSTCAAERVERDIEIHGGVRNWYIDVKDPPKRFRVEIGYLASSGRFFSLARSNTVATPAPGVSQAVDMHWSEDVEDFERIYALSGGYADELVSGDLQHMFEDRLQRPVGSAATSRYGLGTDRLLGKSPGFYFDIDVEAIVYGRTKPNARVSISGEPVKLRSDGTFAVRMSLPDRRQVLALVASSPDGSEQRTIVLAMERNTKVMEPLVQEGTD